MDVDANGWNDGGYYLVDQTYSSSSIRAQSGTAVAQAVSVKLNNNGDASDTTSTFTKASGDISSMTSGGKLSAIFTAISSFFASLKALAFKDTVGTSDIDDDAITAAKVKDGETLPVNVSGTAKHLDCYGFWHTYGTGYYDSSKPYAIIGELSLNLSGNTGAGQLLQFELETGVYARVKLDFKWSNGSLQRKNVYILDSSADYSTIQELIKITSFTYTSGGKTFLCTADWLVWRVRQLDCQTGDCGYTNWTDFPLRVGYRSQESDIYGTLATYKFCYPYANGKVGSPSIPVYVDADGSIKACGFQVNFGSTLVAGSNVLNIAN